jgi:hypothetical protein
MATNDPPIEDPFRGVRRVNRVKPTRRIGKPSTETALADEASAAPVPVARPVPVAPVPVAQSVPVALIPAAPIAAPPTPVIPPPAAPITVPAAPIAPAEPIAAPAEPVAAPAERIVPPVPLTDSTAPIQTAEVASTPSPDSPPAVTPLLVKPQIIAPLELPVREPTSSPRYRTNTTKPRPGTANKSGTSTSSAITIAILSALLLGYAFNIASIHTAADAALRKMNSSAQEQGPTVIPLFTKLLPWLLFVPVVVLFYAIMSSLARAIGLTRKSKIQKERVQRTRPLDEFKDQLGDAGISTRMAAQAFLLLRPHLQDGQIPDSAASLEADFHLTPAQVREMHLNLLSATERESDPGARLPAVNTILDLVTAVHRAPKKARGPIKPVYEPGDPFRRER